VRTDSHNFTRKDGPAGDYVTAIALDKQGKLWFGTFAVVSAATIPPRVGRGIRCGLEVATFRGGDGTHGLL
jgi:hypothetical protein